jgi:hypothetical protein
LSVILPIERPSLGFDPCTGETVELRFIVASRETNEAALIRVRGAARVRATLASIDARSLDDVRHAQAIVTRAGGVMTLVSLVAAAKPVFAGFQTIVAEPSTNLQDLAHQRDGLELEMDTCDKDIEVLEAAKR